MVRSTFVLPHFDHGRAGNDPAGLGVNAMLRGTRLFIWSAVTMLTLGTASLAGAAWAPTLEGQKLALVERNGLDPTDPVIQESVEGAHAIVAVDVQEEANGITVTVETTGTPEYRGVVFSERRRYVLDLFGTLNVAVEGPWNLGDDSPIRAVRHSQYSVDPDYISRLVCDLAEGVEPVVTQEGTTLTVHVPYSAAESGPVLVAMANLEQAMDAEPLAPEQTATEPEPWWVSAEEAVEPEPVEVAQVEATPLAAPESAPAEEAILDEPATREDEPARVEVDETLNTPSMVDLGEADAPTFEPVVEDPPMTMVDEDPVVQDPIVDEPLLVDEPTASAAAAEDEIQDGITSMPSVSGPAGDPFEERVTLTFRDADLNAVLDIIARKGRINILAGRDVSGSVTVRLVDVPLDVALDSVLNVNGYGYIKTDSIYRIVPLSQIGGDEVETVTESFVLSYAKAEDVKDTMKDFLTRNGSINTDTRTNLLIVTDVPQSVERIALLIPQIDRRVEQVLIEVVILDSVLTNNADMGVQWFKGNRDTDDSPPSNLTTASGDFVSFTPPIQGGGFSLGYGTVIGSVDVEAVVSAKVVNSDARVLANPKLLTLNNATATIDIVTEFPFQDLTQTSSGGQLTATSFKEVGTKLKVTPQITNDGYVILEVEPEQSSVVDSTVSPPVVATRRALTTLLVQDHQTVVLGGLRVTNSVLSRTKVPGLGDVPAVKLLFRTTTNNKQDTEILLFLTVHIVESPPIRPHERLVYEELVNKPRKPQAAPELFR